LGVQLNSEVKFNLSLDGEWRKILAAAMTFSELPVGATFRVVKPDGNCGCVLRKISMGTATLSVNTTTNKYPFKGTEKVVEAQS